MPQAASGWERNILAPFWRRQAIVTENGAYWYKYAQAGLRYMADFVTGCR